MRYLEKGPHKAPTSGTEGRNRTGTPVKEPDFESGASTSSATPARCAGIIPELETL